MDRLEAADELADIGREIADGPGWISGLARRLDIDARGLRRMLAGTAPVPPGVLERARGLLADREISGLDGIAPDHGSPAAVAISAAPGPGLEAARIVAGMLERRGFVVTVSPSSGPSRSDSG